MDSALGGAKLGSRPLNPSQIHLAISGVTRNNPHREVKSMANHVCNGAMLKCSMGVAPSSLVVVPANRVMTSSQPAATIMDNKPMVNVMPFGMCISPANPAVAAATAAALGVLTPMPCIPNTTAPWAPGAPTVLVAGQPALDDTSQLMCMWAGVISITSPGQITERIP